MEGILSSTTDVQGAISPYNHLEQLLDEASWTMIEKKAFSPGGAVRTQELANIGKEIARKCSYLPLVAKLLGGLLHLKNRESDWISIRDDDMWNTPESEKKILGVLKLSYNHLPTHLKQCFSYCSIFPKNWEINKETLVHLWMAEGFIKHSDVENEKSIEDNGRGYFETLAWSGFFQDFKKNELDEIETCKMHDVVHDFAKGFSGDNDLVFSKVSELADASEILRLQLDVDGDMSATFLKNLSNAKKLETLIIPEGTNLDPFIFSGNHQLRILHVGPSPNYSCTKVRSLCYNLTHLRYVRLTCLDLGDEVVNDQSITELYNLETLVLTNIGGKIENLFTNVQSLQKLRYLEISWTDMEELPDSVTSLHNLQSLDLNNCELKVIPDSISGLKNLRFLNLSFNPIQELPISLCTLSSLQTLNVNTCKNLKALPKSVAGLTNLRIFDIKNCPLLEALLEDFGALTQLVSLNLEGTGIKLLPESCSNLSNLETMMLSDCELPRDVKSWIKLRIFDHNSLWTNSIVLGIGNLVCLQELVYSVRKKLIYQPECNDGIEELGNLSFLEMLGIVNLQNVEDPTNAERANLKGKKNLRRLELSWNGIDYGYINWCKNSSKFGVFDALQPPTGLASLSIFSFLGRDLPMWMHASSLPNLHELILQNCGRFRQLPEVIGQLPLLRRLFLKGMSFKSLDVEGFPSLLSLHLTDMYLLEELCYPYPCLSHFFIHGCRSLSRIPCFPSLKVLKLEKINLKLLNSIGKSQTSLTKIFLHSIKNLVLFPVSILQNNRNLDTLSIEECNQFQVFRYWFPKFHIGSIQNLEFIDCIVLKFLPDLRGWTSLRKLIIFGCPQVQDSLTYDLKSLSFLKELYVDFIQRDEQQGVPSGVDDCINLMK